MFAVMNNSGNVYALLLRGTLLRISFCEFVNKTIVTHITEHHLRGLSVLYLLFHFCAFIFELCRYRNNYHVSTRVTITVRCIEENVVFIIANHLLE
jgi:hypothetical protein